MGHFVQLETPGGHLVTVESQQEDILTSPHSPTFIKHGAALLSFGVADVDPAEDGSERRVDVEHHAGLWSLTEV